MIADARMNTVGANQKIRFFSVPVGKSGDDGRMVCFLDVDAFGVVPHLDFALPENIKQCLPNNATGYSESFESIIFLASVQHGCNVAQIPGRGDLEFFIVPALLGNPIIDADPLQNAEGIWGECDKASFEGFLIAQLEDFARDILLLERQS